MLTIFAVPKPFVGQIDVIQRNAIASWLRLTPRLQVLLFGNERGTKEAAREFDLDHVPSIRCNEYGTPLVDDIFEQAQRSAAHDLLCYVNSDIILMNEFTEAAAAVSRLGCAAVLVGQSIEVDLRTPLAFSDADWSKELRAEATANGIPRSPFAMDYFLFTRGLFKTIPPFALGRARYDNWLIWRARQARAMVIDATGFVCAIHQRHDYSHLVGGKRQAYYGPEAKRNQVLAGKWCYLHLYSLIDATHFLTAEGIQRRRARFASLRQAWLRYRLCVRNQHA
jgi:hypothetical protein